MFLQAHKFLLIHFSPPLLGNYLYNENSPPAKRRRLTKPNATLSQKIEVICYIKTKKSPKLKLLKNPIENGQSCKLNNLEFCLSSIFEADVLQAVQAPFGIGDSSLTLEEDPGPPRIPSLNEIHVYHDHVRNFTIYRDKSWARPLANHCLAAKKYLAREHINKSEQIDVRDYFTSNR
ncbi:hypothetical protein K3495_g6543 [Podosphaera aphanis]|nr:hypothetical protein K3495_g6543 [Podosphaera aphanis]